MDALIRIGEATKRYAAGGTAAPGPAYRGYSGKPSHQLIGARNAASCRSGRYRS